MNIIDALNPYTKAIKIGAVCLAVVGVFFAGVHVENMSWQDKWDKAVAEQQAAKASTEAAYRLKEQNYSAQLAQKEKEFKDAQDENEARVNSIIADNSKRLRKHFTCPTSGVSQSSTSSSGSDGSSEGGLRKDDAEFLVRYAGRCQAVVEQLSACQAVVRQLEGFTNGK